MKIENWCGHDIRFVEINGEWWAILKDICDALNLRSKDVSQRIGPNMLERVLIEVSDIPSRDVRYEHQPVKSVDKNMLERVLVGTSNDGLNDLRYDHKPVDRIDRGMIGKDIGRHPGENKTRWMLAVNELGIYEALFASRKLEARKFRLWAGEVMAKLRKSVGLKGYEVMKMTDPDIQEQIDCILDTLYWDDEKKCLMQSITVQGGDVEQVPFE